VIRILLLDNEQTINERTSSFLKEQNGFQVRITDSVKSATNLLSQYSYDVIVSEYDIPDLDSISFLKQNRQRGNQIPFIFFTNKGTEEIIIDALNEGADFFLRKQDLTPQILSKLATYIVQAVKRTREKHCDSGQMHSEKIHHHTEYAWHVQTIMNAIPAPVFFRDTSGIYQQCNSAFEALIGIQKSSIIGRSVYDLYPKDLADHYRYMDDLILKNPYVQQYEYVITNAQGEKLDALFSNSAFLSDNGEIKGIMGVILEVTDRKELERIILENEEKYRTIANYTYDWESWLSPGGTYLYISPSCERISGYSADEFYNEPDLITRITHPDDKEIVNHHYSHVPHENDGIFHMDYRIITKKGETRWISHNCQSVFRDDGTWLGRRENKRDITFRKEITLANERANKKLHLLSNITRHDILNQLTIMSGLTDLLSDYSDNPDIRAMLNRMNQTIETIHSQIIFTRDYQEIGTHTPQWHHLPSIVHQAKRGIAIQTVDIDPELENIHILVDPLIEKVFFCLLDNSQRHRKRVTVVKLSCAIKNSGVIIVYEDNGCGIINENKEKIFNQGFGNNTGYGLFLAKEILTISGLNIHETGKFGEGVRFEISIPKGLWRREPLNKTI